MSYLDEIIEEVKKKGRHTVKYTMLIYSGEFSGDKEKEIKEWAADNGMEVKWIRTDNVFNDMVEFILPHQD